MKCPSLLASIDTLLLEFTRTSSTVSSLNLKIPKDIQLEIRSLKNFSDMFHKPVNNNSTLSLKTPKKLLRPGQELHSSVPFFLISARQRYMFDLVTLLKRDHKLLADIMTQEHGKTTPDSMGDVMRGL